MTRSLLTLLVFDPAEEDEYDDVPPRSACSIDVYLQAPPAWRPGPRRTLLQCDALTPSANDDMNPFGILAHIVPQLAEASVRLGQRELAVLCTSVFNPSVYIRLDPRPDGTTTWTFLGSLPQPYGSYYPLVVSPFRPTVASISAPSSTHTWRAAAPATDTSPQARGWIRSACARRSMNRPSWARVCSPIWQNEGVAPRRHPKGVWCLEHAPHRREAGVALCIFDE